MRLRLFTALACLLIFGELESLAQTASRSTRPNNATIHKMVRLLLSNIHQMRCGDGACSAATAEEMEKLPISDEDAGRAFSRGIISGVAELCGVDWQRRNFGPMMAYWRHQRKMSERQLALIAGMHGLAMSQIKSENGFANCNETLKTSTSKAIDFVP